jgi:hypothetical protein
MSGQQGALNKLESGDVLGAIHDLFTWTRNRLAALPGFNKLFNALSTASNDELAIVESLIPVAAQDVVAGGFTTDSFVKAGKDVLAQLLAKNITKFNMQYVMSLLNAEVAPLAPPVSLPASAEAQAAT